MPSARTLISGSLRLLGVLAAGETLRGDDATDALSALNDMVDAWRTERLTLYAQTRSTKVLTANDGQYTIGSGGDINVNRPLWIDEFRLKIGDEEYDLRPYTRDEYQAISNKSLTSELPEGAFYNPEFPLAKIELWPIPTQANTLVVYHPAEALISVASLDTNISQPPGWNKALRYNLALELAPEYGVLPSPLVIEGARDSKAGIKRANQLDDTMETDPLLRPARQINIRTGD